MKDILVFTPVLRLEPETTQALFALEWEGELTFLLQRDNPYFKRVILDRKETRNAEENDQAFANVLHQYQRGREMFLKGKYEAMLLIENDIIPPADTLKRLAALNADLAYGVYLFRGEEPVVNVLRRYYPWPQTSRNIGESMSLHHRLWERAIRQGLTECSGAGLGCVLIKRHVIEEYPFEAPKDRGFFDFEWGSNVHRAGYRMMADMRVLCGHKGPDGKILRPEKSINHGATENTKKNLLVGEER